MESTEVAAPISERIGEPMPESLQESTFQEAPPEVVGGEEKALEPEPISEPESVAEPEPEVASPAPEMPPMSLPREAARQEEEPATIGAVIEKVQVIVNDLKESLDEMEQVLEMLEQVERQQMTDEREIKSLRKALDALHRGRDHGRRQHPQQR